MGLSAAVTNQLWDLLRGDGSALAGGSEGPSPLWQAPQSSAPTQWAGAVRLLCGRVGPRAPGDHHCSLEIAASPRVDPALMFSDILEGADPAQSGYQSSHCEETR